MRKIYACFFLLPYALKPSFQRQYPGRFMSCVVAFQAANDPRVKEAAEIMSIPVIGGVGSWGNNGNEAEENQMVS